MQHDPPRDCFTKKINKKNFKKNPNLKDPLPTQIKTS